MIVATFKAGNGAEYGTVSRPGSPQVVVFKRHLDGTWRGRLEFNENDMTWVWPGDVLPEIQEALDAARGNC